MATSVKQFFIQDLQKDQGECTWAHRLRTHRVTAERPTMSSSPVTSRCQVRSVRPFVLRMPERLHTHVMRGSQSTALPPPANFTTMAREYDLNEPVSPLVLFDDAQRCAHQQIASPPLYRPRARGKRFWLLRCALAIALSILGWVAWSAAIAPVRVSWSDDADTRDSVPERARLGLTIHATSSSRHSRPPDPRSDRPS